MLNDRVRAAILEKPRSDYIKRIAIEEGMISLRQNGWQAVLEGITTPEEVMNVTTKDKPFHNNDQKRPPTKNLEDEDINKDISENQKTKKGGGWDGENNQEERIYERSEDPIEIRYKIIKQDTQNSESITSDGIEHSTVTKDFSAGGLRFISKDLIQ